MTDQDATGQDAPGKDATDAHLRILAEQAEDRLERVHAAEELARRNARVRGATPPREPTARE